ncbi:hypothetical protein ABKV19_002760 [Rosa sericea]
MEITSVSLIRRWPCVDKGGSPLDSAPHSTGTLSKVQGISGVCVFLYLSPERLEQQTDRGFLKGTSAGRNFDSESHFLAGIWWRKLLAALQENIKGKFFSPDTSFMFCVVDVPAGVFFAWLILRPFVVLRWRGRQEVGSCRWGLLLNFKVDDIILHRSGISTTPWRHSQGFAFPLDVFSPSLLRSRASPFS